MALTPITADQQTFAQRVAAGSGLTLAAVLAWMHAENGPASNPLGLMIPGTQTLERYSSPTQAADAVVANLRTRLYQPVLDTVRAAPNDTKAQLAAIANSPWDAGHYTGGQHGPTPGVPWGTTLLGAHAATEVQAMGLTWGEIKQAAGMAASAFPGGAAVQAGVDVTNKVKDYFDPKNWVKSLAGWITGIATTGLAYVVLTALGLALVFVGLNEATGREATRYLAAAKDFPV